MVQNGRELYRATVRDGCGDDRERMDGLFVVPCNFLVSGDVCVMAYFKVTPPHAHTQRAYTHAHTSVFLSSVPK